MLSRQVVENSVVHWLYHIEVLTGDVNRPTVLNATIETLDLDDLDYLDLVDDFRDDHDVELGSHPFAQATTIDNLISLIHKEVSK